MEAAIAALSTELGKFRTGGVSLGMFDHIIVEIGGVKMSLSQIAVVSVLDSKTLSINPFDPSNHKMRCSVLLTLLQTGELLPYLQFHLHLDDLRIFLTLKAPDVNSWFNIQELQA